MEKYLERDAVISECGTYRYLLRRVWNYDLPRALIIMLNPSTADAQKDDPTIRSCTRLLWAAGYGSMEIVNLFAFRATDPKELKRANFPVGPDNDKIIEAAVKRCDVPIAAWGAHSAAYRRGQHVKSLVRSKRPSLLAFELTKSGAPRHPLYIKTGKPLIAWA